MGRLKAFISTFLAVWLVPAQVLAAGVPFKTQTDQNFFGKASSATSKNLYFDFGLGLSNPDLFVDTSSVLNYSKNSFTIGDGLSSSKTVTANVGAGASNPAIRYNPSTSSWEFTTDGTNYSSFGTGSGGAAVEMLVNQGFESGVAQGWSNTGGTLAAVTGGANLLVGRGSASFTASASSQVFQSSLYTVPNGLVSGNCSAAIMYKGGDGTQSFEVVDGSAVVKAGPVVLAASTVAKTVPLTFPCPSSGSLRIKIISSSAGALYSYDQAHLGSVDLNQVSQAQWVGNVTYTGGSSNTVSSTTPLDFTQTGSTVTSAGSITPASGNLIGFNIPSMGPGVYKVVMNTGMICDVGTQDQCLVGLSSVTNSFSGGIAFSNVSTSSLLGIVADTFVDSIQVTSSTGPKTFRLVGKEVNSASNQIFADLTNVPITFDVYYYPSQAQAAVTISNSALNWSGYTNDVTAWNTASTTYADPGSGAGVTLTQTTNTNFGTVTTMAANGAGLTFTPQVTGTYHVAAHPFIASASAAQICARLVDGSNTIIDPGSCIFISGQAPSGTVPLQGDYVVTTSGSPVTLKIQLATNTGTVVMDNGSVAGSPAIQWQISNANQPSSAPVLVGGVVSPSTGVMQTVSVSFAGNVGETAICSSDPCTISKQSGGVSVVNRSSAGVYDIHFSAGVFSSPPTCIGTSMGISGVQLVSGDGVVNTSTVAELTSVVIPGLASTDDGVNVICMGQK